MLKIAAILLIVAGTAGLVFGGFDYTRDKQIAKLGELEFSMKDQEHVRIPVWLSVGGIAIGVGLLLVGGRRR
jgi:H+/Cl- antiporter ClcA